MKTKNWIHYSYHLDHLHFLLWSKYQIYTALLETWILKMKKISAFFKGQLGIINNFIITLLISIPFLCEYQYSLNQIIIKQMHKFLRLKLYFALKSAYRNNYRHICQLITDTKTYWYTNQAHSIIPNQFLYTLEPQISWASQWIEHS